MNGMECQLNKDVESDRFSHFCCNLSPQQSPEIWLQDFKLSFVVSDSCQVFGLTHVSGYVWSVHKIWTWGPTSVLGQVAGVGY
jgi:hypothetical protein